MHMAKVKVTGPKAQSHQRRPRSVIGAVPALTWPMARAKLPPDHALIDGKTFPLSEVFHTFFQFVAERHSVHKARLAGHPQPWTDDPILHQYPFTNVFRVLDRNSQYILNNVILEGSQDLAETFFRVLLFRTFNKIETWELLQNNLGPLTWKTFSVTTYETVLRRAGTALYGSCYIIPAPNLGHERNYSNHLRMIETMMAVDKLPTELMKLKHLKDAHGRIQMYQSMGDFMAMQLVLDLNMMPQYNWSEDEWIALGPGSRACLVKMFGDGILPHAQSAIQYIRDNQHSWFIHCGVLPEDIPRLHRSRPAGLTMADIEHSLCECEKYSRAKFPEIRGKRIKVAKRVFVPRDEAITADIPVNWKKVRHEEAWECPPPVKGTDDTYEVSHIVKEKDNKYLIRWTGYGPEEDSWMPASELGEGAGGLISDWEKAKARISNGLRARSKLAGIKARSTRK